jgi:fatty acyl-CoA reductase
MSSLTQFYIHKNLFLTGVTGFIGKLIVEKLLRICPAIGKIFVLVRPARNLTSKARLKRIFASKCFDKLREMHSNFLTFIEDRVQLIEGDLEEDEMGISEEDKAILLSSTNVIINCGASISWEMKVNDIFRANVLSVKRLILFAKKIKNLNHFIHLSSTGVHISLGNTQLDEKIYPLGFDVEEYLEDINTMNLEDLMKETQQKSKEFGNTYTFSKRAAEVILEKYGKVCHFPVTILRAPSVGPAFHEPFPGWVDKLTGYSGLYFYLGLGRANAYLVNKQTMLYDTPVDH